MQKIQKCNLIKVYNPKEVVFTSGKGAKLFDIDGNEYIDFVSGVAVNALGHSSDVVKKALVEQSEKLVHISNLYYSDKQLELAEKLVGLSNHKGVFFCNSGTEAVEAALKLSRKYGKKIDSEKVEVIYMENSFHGRTMGALSVTGQPKYQENFKPLIGATKAAIYNDIKSVEEIISNKTCAVIIEPVQGEGGVIPADLEYLKKLQQLCDKYDALLIFDEVQCGIGRTGTFYAYENFQVIPDVICMAKGLGGGFPIGAILAGDKAYNSFEPGDHGSTFGGNPLACAVSIAVINELIEKKIIDSVEEKSAYIIKKLNELNSKYNCIEKISGKGLLMGIKFTLNSKKVVDKCYKNKLLLVAAGNNVVRFLPPLNVAYEEIDEALTKLELSISELLN